MVLETCGHIPPMVPENSLWKHMSGRKYRAMFLADYKETVVYENVDVGTRWSRGVGLWHGSFVLLNRQCNPWCGDRPLSQLELDFKYIMPNSLWTMVRTTDRPTFQVKFMTNVAYINSLYPPAVVVLDVNKKTWHTIPLNDWDSIMVPHK